MDIHRLSELDPDSYERMRQELIERFFSEIPEERQLPLRRLQFQIDGIVRRRNPIASSLLLQQKMYDCVRELRFQLNGSQQCLRVSEQEPSASVLVFQRTEKK